MKVSTLNSLKPSTYNNKDDTMSHTSHGESVYTTVHSCTTGYITTCVNTGPRIQGSGTCIPMQSTT